MLSISSPASPLLTRPISSPKPAGKVSATKKVTSSLLEHPSLSSRLTRFPTRDPPCSRWASQAPSFSKLLTNVEKLRLLAKAEKAGLLTAAENLGLSLSAVERLGLLSKAEELGVLSAATDPATPGALLGLSLALLALGPLCVYLVPEEYAWPVDLQLLQPPILCRACRNPIKQEDLLLQLARIQFCSLKNSSSL